MTRPSANPSHRRHLIIYDEDWEWLEATFQSIGHTPGVLVREIIHNHVKKARASYTKALDATMPPIVAGESGC